MVRSDCILRHTGGYHVLPQLIYFYDLSKSYRVAVGEVIETQPQVHNRCRYRFSWDGRVYEHGGRSCGNDNLGQQIVVYFSPTDPSKSINSYPLALFWNDLIPFLLALTLFPIFGALAVYQSLKRRVRTLS